MKDAIRLLIQDRIRAAEKRRGRPPEQTPRPLDKMDEKAIEVWRRHETPEYYTEVRAFHVVPHESVAVPCPERKRTAYRRRQL